MARFDGWSKEDLVQKCYDLEREIEGLKSQIEALDIERSHLQFKIDTELEPRLQSERRRYDNWVTNPER